ncbi:DUF7619 domain-containing protein [Mesonia mobilis]|uniref:Uncharacterized protein n=1 Tax=Mesonia mobilis TaxID=369791 RepID=A0ABQ3C3H1_9FLAO|nr:T9SS type A sorting domain-containing protein [Mesonia mobilis]MBQ0737364.1 T9SS type A sorting domain-containing protein [Aquimarina celericrescens]GGZ62731.1 hypothetical protein GCM10008088_25200 [Mesonia mobilis]
MKKITLFLFCIICLQNLYSQNIDFPDENLKNALLEYEPIIDTNDDGEIQISEALAVTELQLNFYYTNYNITDPTGLENFENLTDLDLYGNSITSIEVSSLINLEYLYLGNNSITGIDVSNNVALLYFDIYDNLITELDVSQNPNIIGLSFFDNTELTYLNLKNGNSSNISLGEGFYETPNLELVCVDEIDIFNPWEYQQLQEINASITTNCNFGDDELNLVSGFVKYDIGLGCDDVSAATVANTFVFANVGGYDYATLTQANGYYALYTTEGNNTLTAFSANSNFTFTPASEQVDFTGYGNQATVNFCAEANAEVNDASIVLLPIGGAVPGFSSNYQIVITNQGTTDLDGEILLTYNENLQTFIEASPSESTATNNTLSFSFTDIAPFQSDYINVEFLNAQPPTLTSGDILDFNVEVIPSVTDDNLENNEFILNQEVVNSYDPNDKRVLEGSQVHIDDAGKYLNYIIRFQNTGTANAQRVAIRDTLSANLDWNSLQMISSSDSYQVNIKNGNAVEFVFDGINLPYEDADVEGSQGYIAYKIKPKSGIAVGDIIAGDAAIYFDFNEPIITNEVSTEFVEELSVASSDFSAEVNLYPNPTSGVVSIQNNSALPIENVEFYSITGQKVLTSTSTQIDLSALNSGVYFVKLIAAEGTAITKKVVKQ